MNAINNNEVPKRNVLGLTGLASSLVGVAVSLISILLFTLSISDVAHFFIIAGLIFFVIGLGFSLVGIFSQPRQFAIAGLVLSLICIAILIVVGIYPSVSHTESITIETTSFVEPDGVTD